MYKGQFIDCYVFHVHWLTFYVLFICTQLISIVFIMILYLTYLKTLPLFVVFLLHQLKGCKYLMISGS